MQPDNVEGPTDARIEVATRALSPVILAEEIAELLGVKPATFLRTRKTLIDARGFPPPLPTGGQSPRWSRRLVDLWIATNGTMQPVDPANLTDPVAAERRALETRIGDAA